MGPAPHCTSCQERDPHGTSCGPAWLLWSPPAASAGRPLSPAVVAWRGAWRGPWGATNGTAGTHEVPCRSSAPACSTSSVPAQGAGGKGASSLLSALPWPLCGLGLCSKAAIPWHRQPGGILSLDKIQQQGAKFTRTIHTPLLTPSPALKTCAGFL